ncbi:MAG TPA: pre-peptidase C-terminal domain-containing protein [Planctomycetaceae bacterium]|nr:pre-peptidase C-terminal domain-containing protein [Planctomycetaceae bacterium]
MLRGMMMVAVGLIAETALAAIPSVESVSPGIGQRGAEFELKLVGAGFNDAEEVLFYRRGVTCLEVRPESENELKLRLRAVDDCPLGSHPFRIRTRRGLSELKTFRVTPLSIVASVEPEEGRSEAQPIARGVTVTGVIESEDVDDYRISLKKGERLAAEVEAIRLGASLLDLKLAVFDPAGKLLAEIDDAPLFRQDPFLTIIAPTDGDYVVRVFQANREGSSDSRYALHVGSFPRPAAIFPLGGPAGATVDVRCLGDAVGTFSQAFRVPGEARAQTEFYPSHGGLTAPTPHGFRVSPFPNRLEQEPNHALISEAEVASLPQAFNGVVNEAGDVDQFRFQASAGESWHFEVFADRLGSPLDAFLSILSDTGDVLAICDDVASHDGELDFQVPESGVYRLQMSDKRGTGGPLFVYRVEVATVEPQLTAFLPRPNRLSQERQTVSIPRGNRVLAPLGVQRLGVTGEARIAATQLPSSVTQSGDIVAADRFWTPVIFEATDDAPLTGTLTGLQVTGQRDGRTVEGGFRQVVDLIAGSADMLYHSAEVDRMAVAVTEAAPFRLQLIPPTAPLAQDGTLAIRVIVERDPGFDAPIDVTFPFLPPWVDGLAKLTIPGDQTSADYVMQAWKQAEIRQWPICAEGTPGASARSSMAESAPGEPMFRRRSRSRGSEQRDLQLATQLVGLSVIAPPVSAETTSAAGEQGQTVTVTYPLKIGGVIPQKLTATLEGLPNRVVAEPVAVLSDSGRVSFAIRLDATAPLGEFTGLVCRLSGEQDGQAVSYCIGRGSVLTVVSPGSLFVDEHGRPLSKLEALRRKRSSDSSTSSKPEGLQ